LQQPTGNQEHNVVIAVVAKYYTRAMAEGAAHTANNGAGNEEENNISPGNLDENDFL